MTTMPRDHRWISLALLVLGGGLALVFLGPRSSLPFAGRTPQDHGVLRVAYTPALSLDPHARVFPYPAYNHLMLCLWEPLVECHPSTGEPHPAAAGSWQWSKDHRVLTLTLREARWSNGERVTAHDFVRGWLRLLRSPISVAHPLFPVKNAENYHRGQLHQPGEVGLSALDDLTLRVELDQPRTSFVAELADPLLAPLHVSSERVLADKSFERQPETLVTNGPFRLIGADADGFRLEASPHYRQQARVRLAGVRFIRTHDVSTGVLLLAAGVADVLSGSNLEPVRSGLTARPLVIEAELVLGVVANYFNVTRGPLRDLRVRQALALALDRASLIEESDRARLVPARSWVPGMPGRPGLALFAEDAAEARRLLAEAGYPGGRDFPVLRMTLPLGGESDPYPAACSERWFKELGIRTYVAYESPVRRRSRITEGDYDLLFGLLVATVPDPADLLTTFSQPLAYNESKWQEEEIVRLLAAANHKTGAERLVLVEQVERRAMAAVPAVPLMFPRRHTLRATEVCGWYEDPLARQSFKRLWLDSAAAPAMATNPERI